jgi:hypothetical protein
VSAYRRRIFATNSGSSSSEHGNLSNVKSVGEGVLEYRIDLGPGYTDLCTDFDGLAERHCWVPQRLGLVNVRLLWMDHMGPSRRDAYIDLMASVPPDSCGLIELLKLGPFRFAQLTWHCTRLRHCSRDHFKDELVGMIGSKRGAAICDEFIQIERDAHPGLRPTVINDYAV